MRRSALALSAAVLGLVVAACGGDDAGSSLEQVGIQPDAPETADEPGAPADPAENGDQPGLPIPPDAAELEELLDELGIDPDELGDDVDLDELLEELDGFISSFGGDGSGVVTVAGTRYEMTSDSCVAFGDDFYIDGPAQGSDGSFAWIDASRSVSTRDDMREFMDEAMLDRMFAESDTLDELFLEVRVGATSRFDFVDDEPNWSSTSESLFTFGEGIVEFEFVGDGIRGAGEATDSNGVALDFGQTVPIEFDLSCD